MSNTIKHAGKKLVLFVFEAMLYPCRAIKSRAIESVLYKHCLQMLIRNNEPYAPKGITSDAKFQRPMEAFTTRWEKLSEAIYENQAKNLLDVGCAEGYMIRRAAKDCGIFAVGVEVDWERIRIGNAQSDLDHDYNHGIIPMIVDCNSIRSLPTFDVVICFSVLHHVIRHHGLEEGRNFLKSLAGITGKCFLFDMCSPEETANDPHWATVLDFIKGDVVGKTGEFLRSAGFCNVRHIADTPGYVAPGIRPLFICEPPKPNGGLLTD
jgi:SAM-dependent methyltransferase